MGFRQKSRGIRFRFPEYIAVLLVGLTVTAGIGWRWNAPRASWTAVTAQVNAISLLENTHAIEASRPTIQLHFTYAAGGRVYRGATRMGPVTRMLYGALPQEVKALLRSKGYLSFKDLPPDIQALLRKNGVSNFWDVPKPLLDALAAQGYHSVKEFPEDVEHLLRSGDYAKAGERAGFSAATMSALANASQAEAASGEQAHRSAAIPSATVLRIRYDPKDPTRYEVIRIPFLDYSLNLVTFFIIATLTLFYCGILYPRWKQK